MTTAAMLAYVGKKVLVLTSDVDSRNGLGKVTSRAGLAREAITIYHDSDVMALLQGSLPVSCVLVDEGQFLAEGAYPPVFPDR